jgi:hypothetical protein
MRGVYERECVGVCRSGVYVSASYASPHYYGSVYASTHLADEEGGARGGREGMRPRGDPCMWSGSEKEGGDARAKIVRRCEWKKY